MANRPLAGKKVAILVEDGFEDSELVEPLNAMKGSGAYVTLVGGASKKSYQGKRKSVEVTSDTTADKLDPGELDAIIIPGGICSGQDAPAAAHDRPGEESQ